MFSPGMYKSVRAAMGRAVEKNIEYYARIDTLLMQIESFPEEKGVEVVHVPGMRFGEEMSRTKRWAGAKEFLLALKNGEDKSDRAVAQWIIIQAILSDAMDPLNESLSNFHHYLEIEKPALLIDLQRKSTAHWDALKMSDEAGPHSYTLPPRGSR